jgi:glutaredoxin-like protein
MVGVHAMTFIERPEADLLRERLRALISRPVQIDLFVRKEFEHFRVADRCATCAEAQQLLEELAALATAIALRVRALPEEQALARELGVRAAPGFVLSGAARGRVRYLGTPLGGEFTNLLEDLIDVSRGRTDLLPASRERLAELEAPVHLELFVGPNCPFCPPVARVVHQLAVESEKVEADVIDAEEFPELAERYGIQVVPSLVVDGEFALAGALPEDVLVGEVIRRAGGRPRQGPAAASEAVRR